MSLICNKSPCTTAGLVGRWEIVLADDLYSIGKEFTEYIRHPLSRVEVVMGRTTTYMVSPSANAHMVISLLRWKAAFVLAILFISVAQIVPVAAGTGTPWVNPRQLVGTLPACAHQLQIDLQPGQCQRPIPKSLSLLNTNISSA